MNNELEAKVARLCYGVLGAHDLYINHGAINSEVFDDVRDFANQILAEIKKDGEQDGR